MGWFIAACITGGIALILGLIALIVRPNGDPELADGKRYGLFGSLALLALAGIFLFFGTFYSQSNGEGVIITRFGGAIVKTDVTQGWGKKAPWDSVHKWDLFTRDISFSEPDSDFEAKFDRGEITAARIATAVKSGDESGAQVWYDLDATYNLVREGEAVDVQEERLRALFKTYRSQDRFTRQAIYPALLQSANTIPSEYTTTQFRGAGSVLAAQGIAKQVNADLGNVGVIITTATVKNVKFTDAVEASLSTVEEKQQQEESARADAAAKDVENEQMIENAEAQAKANKAISDSITPELLEMRRIEALDKAKAVYVVPDGSTPMVQVK